MKKLFNLTFVLALGAFTLISCGKDLSKYHAKSDGTCQGKVIDAWNSAIVGSCKNLDETDINEVANCMEAYEDFLSRFKNVNCKAYFQKNEKATQIKESRLQKTHDALKTLYELLLIQNAI